jgi:hypothetical protein
MYRQTADYWLYGSLIESDHPLRSLLRVAGTTKVVAAEAAYESGTIFFLPLLCTHDESAADSDEDEDDEDQDDDEDNAHETATDEGADAEPQDTDGAVDDLVVQWLIARATTEEVAWPDWIDDYRFQSELDRAPVIEGLEVQAATIQEKLDELTSEQEADRKWKLLVAGSGTPLELAVADALQILGFELQSVVPGRTDIRATRKGIHIVVETKGVAKSAAESHCAQLEKWVAEEKIEEREAKGVLVINAWLNKPPIERIQPAFPSQMLQYAQQRNHCLLTGLQLLNLARTALAQPDRKDELAALILGTTGVLAGWDDPAEVFSVTPS